MTDEPVTVYCLDEDLAEIDHALDHDVATLIGVLRDQYHGYPDMPVKIAAALVRAGLRVCHDYHPNAYFHFLGRLMYTTNREFDDIADWMDRRLSDAGY